MAFAEYFSSNLYIVCESFVKSPTLGFIIRPIGKDAKQNALKELFSAGIFFTGSMTGITDEEINFCDASSFKASNSYCLPRKYGKYILLPPVLCF